MTDDQGSRADQFACTESILEALPDAPIVSNLGVATWVLAKTDERDLNFYMDGAMGGTTATGMGLALGCDEDVVVLDGDGSMMMGLGTLATVGTYGPDNLIIVVMDNGVYMTTGGQEASSPNVDFAGVAESCGVRGYRAETHADFEEALSDAIAYDGPTLIECLVEPLPDRTPDEFVLYEYSHSYLTHRFRDALKR